jgi:beta-glucosidase
MASFNEISGTPSSGSNFLLSQVLRDEWGFDGFVVSDWNSIGELINHGYAEDLKDAGRISLNAGLDMDMESRSYISHLYELIKENKVTEQVLETSVKRILRIKFLLGLFDDPYKYCSKEREQKNILTKEAKDAALEVAKRSIVLLKNENELLPLNKNIGKIALIGPLADSDSEPLGAWATFGNSEDVVTVLEGLKKYLGDGAEILYSKGCEIDSISTAGFEDAIETANKSDLVILCLGESKGMSGEASNRSSLQLPGVQQQLAKEIYKTGKPVVVVLMNGRPLSIEWIDEKIPAVIEAWFPGITCGDAIAQVLFGEYNPSGKLPVTFPRHVGQVPIYYNHKSTGRPGDKSNHYTSQYLDLPLTPLYPFGFGLSYTTFEYSNLSLNKNSFSLNDEIKISFDVENTGKYDGEEVVQLYVQDLVGSVTRPVRELKRFQKIFLKKGESKNIQFTLLPGDLSFYNADMKFVTEPGSFKIFAGTNSSDTIENSFEIVE